MDGRKGMPADAETAPAKVNLTLQIRGRRADGYHLLDSLVAFADCADRLAFTPGRRLGVTVAGSWAPATGAEADNLVVRAAAALAARIPGLQSGHFTLEKNLPVAAGLGGGSADAAAALRLLARANGIALDDPRLVAAARETGADVPVCLAPQARIMGGIGEKVGAPLGLPPLPAVLVNPRVPLPTATVFAALGLEPGMPLMSAPQAERLETRPGRQTVADWIAALQDSSNDLEAPAIRIQPAVADVLAALRTSPECRLARMSGSGATCFGLYPSEAAAARAAASISAAQPGWWCVATLLR